MRSQRKGLEVFVLRFVLALVLLAHGIGHSMGLLAVSKVAVVNPAWTGDTWILGTVGGTTFIHAAGIVLWTVALVGFTALAAVVVGWLPTSLWAPAGIVASVASLIGIVLFPVAFPLFSTIGAAAVDLAVLAAIVWLSWTPADLAS
ncbi:MAG TPA: hypothetical protein VEY67_00070 [Candidatus Dormibacteraeota bacterium]|nr:hypothetical protein [Candidatus Dormibacteraeota bacterium]